MKRWLKCDFHIHTNKDLRDLQDNTRVEYSPKQLIDTMVEKGFDVLAITHHDALFYPDDVVKYAQQKGILLIPGIERTIMNQHVVILNVEIELSHIKQLDDLATISERSFIFAPHPYYTMAHSLGNNLVKHIDLFEAIEYSSVYIPWYNTLNNKAKYVAKRYKKPMIGTSDAHHFFQLGKTYSLVYAEKNISSLIAALKQGHIRVKTQPLPVFPLILVTLKILFAKYLQKTRSFLKSNV